VFQKEEESGIQLTAEGSECFRKRSLGDCRTKKGEVVHTGKGGHIGACNVKSYEVMLKEGGHLMWLQELLQALQCVGMFVFSLFVGATNALHRRKELSGLSRVDFHQRTMLRFQTLYSESKSYGWSHRCRVCGDYGKVRR